MIGKSAFQFFLLKEVARATGMLCVDINRDEQKFIY